MVVNMENQDFVSASQSATSSQLAYSILPWTFIVPFLGDDFDPSVFAEWVKINQVQDKFPHDNLSITEGEVLPRYRLNASRRRSAPSAVLKAALVPKPHLALVRGFPAEGSNLKIKPDGTEHTAPPRHYVQEGSAQVTTGVSTQERHLFLLSDLLFVAKAKSAATYKLKHRIRVSELWLSNCVDDVCDSRPVDKSFVIGWPTTNCVFTFSSTEERDSWYSSLNKYINIQKTAEDPKAVTLKVYNRDMESADSFGVSKTFTVTNTDDAASVVKMSLEQFQIQTDDASEYHLWVLSGKENCAYPLLGHEFPFAIKMNHIREGSFSEDDGLGVFDFDQQLPTMDPLSPTTQCQFILTKSRKPTKLSTMDGQQSSKKWTKQIKKSPIINWAMQKKTSGSKSHSPDPHSPPAGKFFELPLDVMCTEEEPVPKPVQEILKHMFRFGPGVNGIFRRSANAKRAKEIKLDLDSGKEVMLEEVSVLITASILKEFLRRLPDCILDSDDYEEFIATSSIDDREERIKNIKWLLQNLNMYSYEILKRFMCVLYHIADNSNINSMNAYNLAVCVAPSMLWPPKGSNIAATEQSSDVPPFVQFLIENCVEIFGEDVVTILGDRSEIVLNQDSLEGENGIEVRTYNSQSSADDALESPDPLSPKNEHNSLHLSDSNLYDPSGRSKNFLSASVTERNSASTPSSPCVSPNSSPKLRRSDNSSGPRRSSEPSEVSNSESIKMKIKGYRKSARSRRQLSSTTTSAELIEHKSTKTTPSGKRIETAVLKRANSPMTVQATPVDAPTIVKPISKFGSASNLVATANRIPAIKQATKTPPSGGLEERVSSPDNLGLRSPSPTMTPDQVFQAVDRRRQPAAPSYHQHMLRKIGNKPAFFQGKVESEDSNPVRHASRDVDNASPRSFNRSNSVPKDEAVQFEHLELSKSEPASPKTPISPTIRLEDQSWNDQRDDMSTSSGSSSTRRLEHSPFGLSLHHKRNDSKKGQKFPANSSKTKSKSPNERQLLPNGGNTPHALFPHSEFFPHEATQAKSPWSSECSSPVRTSPLGSPLEINNNPIVKPLGVNRYSPGLVHATLSTNIHSPGISPSLSRRKNSHTSSSSSVSSSDDRSSVGNDSVVSDTKSTSTQIKDIKDLLSAQAQTNGLKISAATAEEIAKVKDMRTPGDVRNNPGYTSPSHDDMAKMMFTEESYV